MISPICWGASPSGASLFLGFLVVITIVLPSMRPVDIFASLGVGSVAIGFAFKDILQNWIAGFFILIRRPFHRGDQIKIGDIEGTVQAVETRATLVKTYSGRLVIIPNSDIYTRSVTVHTAYEHRRTEIVVPVGLEVDLDSVDAGVPRGGAGRRARAARSRRRTCCRGSSMTTTSISACAGGPNRSAPTKCAPAPRW